MLDLNSARVWLFMVPLLACRPGGDEVGEEEVGESGPGESGTGDGDGEAESSESGTTTETTSETTTDETETTTGETETTTDETETTDTGETETTTETGDGDGDNSCVVDADCSLVNDCCNCTATPVGQEPGCDIPECFVPTCQGEYGGFEPEAECSFGTCQLSQTSCDLDQITCPEAPPLACGPGTIRSEVDGCWGPCVAPVLCDVLPSKCESFTCGLGYACLNNQVAGTSKCIPLPEACNGPNCDCVEPWFDEVCAGTCGTMEGTLLCQ